MSKKETQDKVSHHLFRVMNCRAQVEAPLGHRAKPPRFVRRILLLQSTSPRPNRRSRVMQVRTSQISSFFSHKNQSAPRKESRANSRRCEGGLASLVPQFDMGVAKVDAPSSNLDRAGQEKAPVIDAGRDWTNYFVPLKQTTLPRQISTAPKSGWRLQQRPSQPDARLLVIFSAPSPTSNKGLRGKGSVELQWEVENGR